MAERCEKIPSNDQTGEYGKTIKKKIVKYKMKREVVDKTYPCPIFHHRTLNFLMPSIY